MASYSVRKRVKKDGTPKYQTFIRVKESGKVVYTESRTFTKEKAAQSWGKKRVVEIEEQGYRETGSNVSLRDLIQTFLDDPHIQLGRTKVSVLKMLCDCDIGNLPITELKAQHVIEHCKNRKETGTKPQTINHDVSYLRWALKSAKPHLGYDVSDQCVVDAYPVLHDLTLIAKSERRSRRPTSKEIDKLKEGLKARESHRENKIPYIDILDFSILSCMRIGEVCAIRWEDVDEEQKAVLVRDRKDPRKKVGNHMLVPLLGGSWEILQRQPKTDERIFPVNSRSVTAGFQRVRNALGIEDLRYHDLRREGASRLFELGYTIDEVAQVTGHRNINTLWQIYTELFPRRLHDKSLNQK
ncbi:integrase [Neiella marina]|uniref:Integrase n=1 Tax=Neiella marina TaxID=508461 RepID=A0A8J2U5W5_9GAMM|nr:site-specific integrase [Neiella marina]GGA80513.1 integrase [Neiella marina]